MGFSTKDKLSCARRELEMRKMVYPRRVASGRMTSYQEAREIALMAAIVQDYERLVDDERSGQSDLFKRDPNRP